MEYSLGSRAAVGQPVTSGHASQPEGSFFCDDAKPTSQGMHKLSATLSSGSWLPDLSCPGCPGPEIREGGLRPYGDGEKPKLSSGSYLPDLTAGLPGQTSPQRMPIGGGSERASSSQSWLPELAAPTAPGKNHGTKRGLSTGSRTAIKKRPAAAPKSKSRLSAGSRAAIKKDQPKRSTDPLTNPWRAAAKDDLQQVAMVFGSDLAHVFAPELSEQEAKTILRGSRVASLDANNALRWSDIDDMKYDEFQFWEIFSGSGNATVCYLEQYKRMLATGSSLEPTSGGIAVAGPPVDIAPCRPGTKAPATWKDLPQFDIRVPSHRRLIWAYMKVFKPKWVHTAPPCTFWTPLSRRCNKRSDAESEAMRLEALVFIIFSVQLCRYQLREQRFCSFEQPPTAASWRLDIVRELVSSLAAGNVVFDSCAWGHRDPGNNMPYLKRQRLIGNVSLASLVRRCSCQVPHQTVEGTITGGPRRGVKRSVVAGEYPLEFCRALADLIRAHVGAPSQ